MDLIYVSDSSFLLKPSAFFTIMHHENDIRQPLFAVFSAPLFGFAYLIGKVVFRSDPIQVYLYNCIHVVLIFLANYMLARSLRLERTTRILFVFSISSMYSVMLYLLLIEQYPIAYFYLILVFCYGCSQKESRFALYGAGGTLLTSLALIFFNTGLSIQSLTSKAVLKKWVSRLIKQSIEFIYVFLLFGRFDLIYGIKTNIELLKVFTGYTLSIYQRLKQYVYFVQSCFFAPMAGVSFRDSDSIIACWCIGGGKYYITGIIIIVLVLISAILNRKNICCQIASFWTMFSFLILCLCGWGTVENGLILYCLYFGWSYYVLIVLLVQWITEKIKIKTLPVFVISVLMAAMLIYNIPHIIELLKFGMQYYPLKR